MSWSRSLGEIAVLMVSRTERWSSGVGCSRNSRKRSPASSRSERAARSGPHQEPHCEAHHQRLDARLEHGDPDRGAEHEVQRPPPQPEAEQQHQHHPEQADGPDQRRDVDLLAVDERDHDQREQVVHDHDREHEGPQAVRNAAAEKESSPSAKAVSVDIAIPQPSAAELPRLNAR